MLDYAIILHAYIPRPRGMHDLHGHFSDGVAEPQDFGSGGHAGVAASLKGGLGLRLGVDDDRLHNRGIMIRRTGMPNLISDFAYN